MNSIGSKNVLISGASFAGLSTAFWLNKLGFKVTVVEIANGLKKGGTPVNIGPETVDIVRRMGLLEKIRSVSLHMEGVEFKNNDDVTVGALASEKGGDDFKEEYEIERDRLLEFMYEEVKNNVEFIFSQRVVALSEVDDSVDVTFKDCASRKFNFVIGCDGIHSAVRRLTFGDERAYSHFLNQYFSITIVKKLFIKPNTSQMYNEPGKAVMINGYEDKTDIVLCFHSEKEIPYDYRNEIQQRQIIFDQFTQVGWRTPELLAEIKKSETFYFDKVCQIKMPSWTKGRVALVGDAGYCASPAAGMGGSLAIIGAAALADAFEKYPGNFQLAFQEYNTALRPFINEVQSNAETMGLEMLVPTTQEAIDKRNSQTSW